MKAITHKKRVNQGWNNYPAEVNIMVDDKLHQLLSIIQENKSIDDLRTTEDEKTIIKLDDTQSYLLYMDGNEDSNPRAISKSVTAGAFGVPFDPHVSFPTLQVTSLRLEVRMKFCKPKSIEHDGQYIRNDDVVNIMTLEEPYGGRNLLGAFKEHDLYYWTDYDDRQNWKIVKLNEDGDVLRTGDKVYLESASRDYKGHRVCCNAISSSAMQAAPSISTQYAGLTSKMNAAEYWTVEKSVEDT